MQTQNIPKQTEAKTQTTTKTAKQQSTKKINTNNKGKKHNNC